MRISFLRHVIPVFDAGMNGTPVRMILDTGAGISAITPGTDRAIDLPSYADHLVRLSGTGGTVFVPMATVRNFSIGRAHGFVLHFVVAPIFGARHPFHDAVSGIFGADILRNYGVDLDFPAHEVLMLKTRACGAPWPGVEPIRFELLPNGQIMFPIMVDGHKVSALLDTGSSLNDMPNSLYRSSGLAAAVPTHLGSTIGHGIGARSFKSELYRFHEAVIGGVTVRDPIFGVGGEAPVGGYALIGDSFIRQHEIYISYAAGILYVRP